MYETWQMKRDNEINDDSAQQVVNKEKKRKSCQKKGGKNTVFFAPDYGDCILPNDQPLYTSAHNVSHDF